MTLAIWISLFTSTASILVSGYALVIDARARRTLREAQALADEYLCAETSGGTS